MTFSSEDAEINGTKVFESLLALDTPSPLRLRFLQYCAHQSGLENLLCMILIELFRRSPSPKKAKVIFYGFVPNNAKISMLNTAYDAKRKDTSHYYGQLKGWVDADFLRPGYTIFSKKKDEDTDSEEETRSKINEWYDRVSEYEKKCRERPGSDLFEPLFSDAKINVLTDNLPRFLTSNLYSKAINEQSNKSDLFWNKQRQTLNLWLGSADKHVPWGGMLDEAVQGYLTDAGFDLTPIGPLENSLNRWVCKKHKLDDTIRNSKIL
jgi:hypothetical protein